VNYSDLEQQLRQTLGLEHRLVAVSFRAAAPEGVTKFNGSVPSGCTFWRLAAQGQTFYTIPSDHYNCPIGSYTHNISLPDERAQELNQTLSLMTTIGYIKMEEISGIYRLSETPGVVIYAPLGATPVDPDLIIVIGRPGRLMLVQEAAIRAGVPTGSPLLGRPTCMALPAALATGIATSTGCIGNRIYTDITDDDLYLVFPATNLAGLAEHAQTISTANAQLHEYHLERRRTLATVNRRIKK
jgi:uncharacterized protein (DUF169 family)